MAALTELEVLEERVVACEQCPRLVEWTRSVAAEKKKAYADQEYWGRPVPGFGDADAAIAVIGLAPAAHGANRTGRMFTGDRSGDWLYRGLYRAGLANQPTSTDIDDGLTLSNAWVTSAVKCAPPLNKPTAEEQRACQPYLSEEVAGLKNLRVLVALGSIGATAVVRHFDVRPRPKFGHGLEVGISDSLTMLCSYHVSQQNTFTGRLTEQMLDDVFARAVELAAAPLD